MEIVIKKEYKEIIPLLSVIENHNYSSNFLTEHQVEINKITVSERIRKDLGNIDELSENIKKYGLLQPKTKEKICK